MDTAAFLEVLKRRHFFADQVVHVRELPERPARFAPVEGGLHPEVSRALARIGVEQLYLHQAAAVEKVRAGGSLTVVTGTASGKTLCYAIPVAEALVQDPSATMLFLYPTKALAQDQWRGLERFREALEGTFLAGTYDGDTPASQRRRLRDSGSVVLSNPDMLHQGILPQHARWNRFFARLRYVVIDEIHAYRGVFGSHLANVMRRLHRICAHYGSQPQFICSSATIANPREHAERICGVPMGLVDEDGSPRGRKRFVMWNPPVLGRSPVGDRRDWRLGGERRSAVGEAVGLMAALVEEGVQTIAFVRTRLAAELIFKDCRDRLRPVSPRLSEAIHAYRGGYLPEERRQIERRLASKEILGVASTNALELGIDIGSLDACILVGYPGTVASLWQQAGRAGRGGEEAAVFLVAQNAPMDQFLMAHADYLFAQSPEQAVVDPDNPHIVVGHIRCAVNELPLADTQVQDFGALAPAILELLEEDQLVRHLEGRWYWASSEYPAAQTNLRNIAGPVYTIQEEAPAARIIGTMDEISAMSQLHTHAVYLHGADTYLVERLDLDQKIAFVQRRDLDYYTQAVTTSQIRIDSREEEQEYRGGQLGYGDVTVTTSIPMFKKIRFHARDSLGFEKLELPPQLLETVAFWFVPPDGLLQAMSRRGMLMGEALVGLGNLLVEVAPLFVMCDTQDIGTVVDARNLGRDALFLHDKHPGGMGYARRCLERFDEILHTMAEVVRHCACEDGCPSCVGSAVPASAMTDLDSAVRGRIPSKPAAVFLLVVMLGEV
ncbi:MAG: DEAD/DEAH box helicase [Candidatus Latescibacterota bacterium]